MGPGCPQEAQTEGPPQADGMISDEKFGKHEHLLKSKQFSVVYKKGRSYRSDYLVAYCLPNDTGITRIGFSISSKKVRLATDRNRLRRLVREVFRKIKKDLRPGHDLVIVVSRAPSQWPQHKDVEAKFFKLLKLAGIL